MYSRWCRGARGTPGCSTVLSRSRTVNVIRGLTCPNGKRRWEPRSNQGSPGGVSAGDLVYGAAV